MNELKLFKLYDLIQEGYLGYNDLHEDVNAAMTANTDLLYLHYLARNKRPSNGLVMPHRVSPNGTIEVANLQEMNQLQVARFKEIKLSPLPGELEIEHSNQGEIICKMPCKIPIYDNWDGQGGELNVVGDKSDLAGQLDGKAQFIIMGETDMKVELSLRATNMEACTMSLLAHRPQFIRAESLQEVVDKALVSKCLRFYADDGALYRIWSTLDSEGNRSDFRLVYY